MHEHTIFNRGMLITSIPLKEIEEKIKKEKSLHNIKGWHKTFFGPYKVWTSPRLDYAAAGNNNYAVAIAGLCLNPFDHSNSNKAIAEKLFEILKDSQAKFFDYIDQLSGSFIILYRHNATVKCIQDAAATKPLYFHKTNEGVVSASTHSRILADLHDLEVNKEAKQTLLDSEYKKDPSRYLPGNLTPFTNLRPLYANNQLILNSGITQRFFPREALPPIYSLETISEKAANILVNQAKLIHARGRPIYIALTAGRDSRVSASSFYGLDNTTYFTFHNANTGHLTDDVKIASQLAELAKTDIKVFELEKYNHKSFTPSFATHSPMGIWESAALCYLTEFPSDAIHIRSTVSEIGRNFYKNRINTQVTASNLAAIYTKTRFSSSPITLTAMQEFIHDANFKSSEFYNYEMHDLFYWEHRNSKWQNTLCQEAEMASDVFIPFNNRSILKLLLAAPAEARIAATIHESIPRMLAQPFSGIPYIS